MYHWYLSWWPLLVDIELKTIETNLTTYSTVRSGRLHLNNEKSRNQHPGLYDLAERMYIVSSISTQQELPKKLSKLKLEKTRDASTFVVNLGIIDYFTRQLNAWNCPLEFDRAGSSNYWRSDIFLVCGLNSIKEWCSDLLPVMYFWVSKSRSSGSCVAYLKLTGRNGGATNSLMDLIVPHTYFNMSLHSTKTYAFVLLALWSWHAVALTSSIGQELNQIGIQVKQK